jgi:hypothetical protein
MEPTGRDIVGATLDVFKHPCSFVSDNGKVPEGLHGRAGRATFTHGTSSLIKDGMWRRHRSSELLQLFDPVARRWRRPPQPRVGLVWLSGSRWPVGVVGNATSKCGTARERRGPGPLLALRLIVRGLGLGKAEGEKCNQPSRSVPRLQCQAVPSYCPGLGNLDLVGWSSNEAWDCGNADLYLLSIVR